MPNRRILIRALKYALSLGRPGPDLSWITGLVAVSGTLQSRHISDLAEMGIKSIVDLRREGADDHELLTRHSIRYLRLPTTDHHSPSQGHLMEGGRWVADEIRAGRRTLVHCKEGIGRSIGVVCCAFVLAGYSLSDAIRLVKSKRWGVALNGIQMSGLEAFEQAATMTGGPVEVASDGLRV